jgi:thiol-disulfide isomerase/thioredoxin
MKKTTKIFCLFILSSLGLFAQTNVTFKLDMNQSTMPAGSIPEVNGTFNNWCGSCASMTDANSDGIWEIIISLAAGMYEYKFSYSNWTGQESLLPGSSCTITTGANTNRSLTVGPTAMVLPTVCYGSCSACGVTPPPPTQAQVTFKVDVSQSGLPVGAIPEVNGTFNNWCGSCNAMTDANADGIWETTILLNSGSYEYKFSYSTWTGQETLVPGSSCTITTGANTNRSLTVGSTAVVLPSVCYGLCTACSTGPSLTQMNLPVTFEGNTVDYGVIGFEGAEASTIVTDPTNSSNTVVKVIKSASAQPWAGTTITAAAALGLASPVPFSASSTSMTLKVWSPDAGIQVRLKVENHSNVNQSVETEATTTVANGWQTLVFNFANQAPGTAALNLAYSLDKVSVFMNFSVPGSSVGEKTYYFDDLMMADPSLPVLVTFNVDMSLSTMPAGSIPEVNGTFNNWCGNCNAMTDANSDGIWETTISLAAGSYEYKFSYSSWSGQEMLISGSSCTITTGTNTNRTLSVGSTAMILPTVCWNSCSACGVTPPPPASPLQPAGLVANSPTTSSIFVACGPNQVGGNNILYRLFYSPTASAPMNPQTASEYTFGTTAGDGNGVGPFGFNVTGLQAATNYTFWLYQYNTADQLFSTPASVSETTLGGGTAVPITFTVDMNQSSMPAGSIPEVNGTFNGFCGSCNAMTDANSDGIWETTISLAAGSYEYKFSYSAWAGQETLTEGSPCTVTNFGYTNRSLTVGSAAMVLPTVCYGSCTACSTGPFLTQMNLPVTFEGNTVDYGVIGFEGAEASTIVTDPTNSANTVVKVIKSASAQPWAGTTITAAAALGLASPVPFSATNTSMSLKVWSPDAGIQVRLKVENHSDVNQSVETEATTTVANGWQTLVFNFANQASGTAALNLAYSLDKASVFMNFSVPGSSVGEKTYYFDDLMMYVPSTGPTSSILSGSSAICAGDSTNLSVQIVGGTSPYTVVITDGTNNYSSSGTSPVLFTVSPTLTTTTYSIVSVSGGGVGTGNSGTATVSVTPNSINSLTISAVDSYTWSNTGQTYDTSGTYTGTTENCVTEQLILTITGAGLEDLSDMGISVHPNPSNGLFSIMNSEQLNLIGSITDCSGRVIYSADFSNLENTIDISIAARGIYYLKLSSLNYSKVVQIFKN